MRTWLGLFTPTGTPRDIVDRLNSEVVKGLFNNAAMRDRFQVTTGLEWDPPAGTPAESFGAFLKADRAYYAAVIKAAGIQPE